jgi:hypothetical protein
VSFRRVDCTTGTLLNTGSVTLLSPDSSASTTGISWTPSAMGEVEICATIDPGGLIAESREDNNRVIHKITVLKALADLTAPHVDSFTVQKGAVATADRNVKLDCTVSDPAPSSGVASLFYQEFEYHQGVKSWIPIQQSGWRSYAGSSTDFDWRLVPFAGLHYLQAWAIDNAGNISVIPYKRSINYTPPSDSVRRQQIRIYRQALTLAQTFTVTVTPVSGDPDLYVWAPDSATRPPWVSNLAGAIDEVIMVAPIAGVYQVEVHGYTAAQYQLAMGVSAAHAMMKPLPSGGIDPNKAIPDEPEVRPTDEPSALIAMPSATLWQNWLPLIIR